MGGIVEKVKTSKVWIFDGREYQTKGEAERALEWVKQEAKRECLTFEVHDDHLKLMKRTYFSWDHCEYGAPSVNPKRPYGNSDVEHDIAGVLGLELAEDDYGSLRLSEEQSEYCANRHLEMEAFFQILCRFGEIPSGKYAREATYHKWEKVPE